MPTESRCSKKNKCRWENSFAGVLRLFSEFLFKSADIQKVETRLRDNGITTNSVEGNANMSTIAIPIPLTKSSLAKVVATTPSLQSVLEQKRHSLSNNNMSASSTSTNSSSTSIHSLMESIPSSLESCEDSHPLKSFNMNVMNEIDEEFFNNASNIQLFTPIIDNDIDESDHVLHKKSSFVSNLTKSIKNFTKSTIKQNDFNLFNIQPRLTDDKFIMKKTPTKSMKDTELETFKITSRDDTTLFNLNSELYSSPMVPILRNREARINSQFLRLYSYESSSRQKGLLPDISQQEEDDYLTSSIPQSLRNSNNEKEFALLIRQKLWQSVVLPPREDPLILQQPEYIYNGDEEITNSISLIRKLGDVKPWITLEDENNSKKQTVLKPKGVLNRGVQFTVKGWCNSRWLPNES